MLEGETGTGPDLDLVPGGDGDREPGGKEPPLPRLEVASSALADVGPGRYPRCCWRRQGQTPLAMRRSRRIDRIIGVLIHSTLNRAGIWMIASLA